MLVSKCLNPIWRTGASVYLKVLQSKEIHPFSTRYTQSSTSQKEGSEKSIRSMRWDRLRQHLGCRRHRKHQSNAMTSLKPYLDKTSPSEPCWPKESLALGKRSLYRSSFWTGLKEKPTKMFILCFHCFFESWIWLAKGDTHWKHLFICSSEKLRDSNFQTLRTTTSYSYLMVWMSVDCLLILGTIKGALI